MKTSQFRMKYRINYQSIKNSACFPDSRHFSLEFVVLFRTMDRVKDNRKAGDNCLDSRKLDSRGVNTLIGVRV